MDAALAKGATNIAGLNFFSSRTTEARREAPGKAVLAARFDADAMAKAAGCQFGALIEIVGPSPFGTLMLSVTDGLRLRSVALPVETPVSPGELKISEEVTVRWAIRQ